MPDQPEPGPAKNDEPFIDPGQPGENRVWEPPPDPPRRREEQLRPPSGPNYEAEPQAPTAWPTDPTNPVPGWQGPHPWVDPAGSAWAGGAAPDPAPHPGQATSNPPKDQVWTSGTSAGSAVAPPSGADPSRPADVPPMYPPGHFAPGQYPPPPGPGTTAQQGAFPGAGTPPPAPPPPRGSGGPGGSGDHPRRRAGLPVAVTIVLILVAVAAGFGGGLLANTASDSASPSARHATVSQVTIKGSAAQPAAAVAKALSPAVVQLQTGNDLGSGFVYDPSGLILTAAHVVENQSQVEVTLSDGTRLVGRVLGKDLSSDVAVVKIKPPDDLAVAALGTSSKVEVGEVAIAIGSPFGLSQTVTQGIVSATARPVQTKAGSVPMIQTDAPINPGNSGGALANVQGQVIGINDAIYTDSSGTSLGGEPGNVGVGFAIPIDLARTVADRIVANKPINRGYLGIEGANATGTESGAIVKSVQPDTPADKAGLKEGDLITAVNGKKVTTMLGLAAAITTHQPGDTITLTVERGDTSSKVKVTLGNRSEALGGQSSGGQDNSPFVLPGPGG